MSRFTVRADPPAVDCRPDALYDKSRRKAFVLIRRITNASIRGSFDSKGKRTGGRVGLVRDEGQPVLALFDLMQERDDLIQQMLDWIETNPGADTDDLLNKAVDIQQRDAGFR